MVENPEGENKIADKIETKKRVRAKWVKIIIQVKNKDDKRWR
jgi:hypothetical protein